MLEKFNLWLATALEQLCPQLCSRPDEHEECLLSRDSSVLIFNLLGAEEPLSSFKVSHFMGFLLHQVFVGSSADFALPAWHTQTHFLF